MKKISAKWLFVLPILLYSCTPNPKENTKNSQSDIANKKREITTMLDSFNVAAANADFKGYFDYFTDDATFLGTDATENWDKKSFMDFAKPHFDRKKTWNFTSLERHIYFSPGEEIAWFDELLNTQMKICRGSGVLVRQKNAWKVQQYVLSMTIPNSTSDSIIQIKAAIEDSIISRLTGKK